jgi:hypothetical protein
MVGTECTEATVGAGTVKFSAAAGRGGADGERSHATTAAVETKSTVNIRGMHTVGGATGMGTTAAGQRPSATTEEAIIAG